jgi:acid phosphatase family membrane protein YuiD
MSKVWLMMPSVEFSTGTTPLSHSSLSTALKTSLMLFLGMYRDEAPKARRQAW